MFSLFFLRHFLLEFFSVHSALHERVFVLDQFRDGTEALKVVASLVIFDGRCSFWLLFGRYDSFLHESLLRLLFTRQSGAWLTLRALSRLFHASKLLQRSRVDHVQVLRDLIVNSIGCTGDDALVKLTLSDELCLLLSLQNVLLMLYLVLCQG